MKLAVEQPWLEWAWLWEHGCDAVDMQTAANTIQGVRRLVEEMGEYPDIDLFNEYL
jgi:hypothetical protein